MTEPLPLLSRALDQAGRLVEGITPGQAALPTPCASWDVRALVAHLVDDLGKFAVAASGGRPDWRQKTGEVDGDWGVAFREGAARLIDAWRAAGDPDAMIRIPIGEVPASFVINQHVAEFAVHAWDLVTATGQPVPLDPEIAQAALAWSRTTLRPEFRGAGKAFGAEVAVPADADVYDRLAGFFGRSPAR